MSKKYTSPEHSIRNIIEGNRGKQTKEISGDFFDTLRDLFDMKPSTSKGELVPTKPNAPTDSKQTPTTTDALPATKPVEAPAAKQVEAPSTKTTTKSVESPKTSTDVNVKNVEATKNLPAVRTTELPSTKTEPQTKVRSAEPPAGKVRDVETPKRVRSIGGIGLTPGQPLAISSAGVIGVPDYLHRAKSRLPDLNAVVHEENTADAERRNIENVARPNSDRKKVMARNESIKKQIIDENAKKKSIIKNAIDDKYSKSVEISPEIKSDKLTEGRGSFVRPALNTAAGGMGLTQGENIEKKLQQAGIQNPESQRTWVDTALDVASLAPVVGAPFSLASAIRSYQRGDYGDAALDALGVIPGASLLTKGLKWGGKAAKNAGVMSKITGLGDTTQRVGGATIVPSMVSPTSKVGKAIDKTSNAAETVATPGNLFQLGQSGQGIAQSATEFGKDFYDQKIKNKEPK